MSPAPDDSPTSPGWLRRWVQVEPEEVAPLLLGILFYFFLLWGYYIVRPIREAFGITWGTGNLPSLFVGTLVAMIALNPIYSRLVARMPRSKFVPLVYRVLILCLLGFFAGLKLVDGASQTWLKYAFYIFISVFNLFIVSIFWSLMSDLFDRSQARRLYGSLAVGGSLGAMAGSFVTRTFIDDLGHANLILVSCVLLELAGRCAVAFNRRFAEPRKRVLEGGRPQTAQLLAGRDDVALGGSAWAGMRAVFRSPYLIGIGLYVLIYGLSSTFAYFFQAGVVEAASQDHEVRTRIFADIDMYTSLVTLLFQGFLFARLLRWVGPTVLLCLLPVYSALGFLLLSSDYIPEGSLLIAFAVFQILRRSIGYGIKKPTQELLFTAVSPEEKYKAKNLIDLSFARGGDMTGAGASAYIEAAGLGLLALAATAAPVSLVWMIVGLGLGLGYRRRARILGDDAPADQNA